MERKDLREVLQQQPFWPLRLHLMDDTVFEIRHPDMARLRRSSIRVNLPSQDEAEREALVPLASIHWVEIIIRGGK